jgi:hypothetical protein
VHFGADIYYVPLPSHRWRKLVKTKHNIFSSACEDTIWELSSTLAS